MVKALDKVVLVKPVDKEPNLVSIKEKFSSAGNKIENIQKNVQNKIYIKSSQCS